MNYNDRGSCATCKSAYDYDNLQETTDYSCDQKCLCRFNSERSVKDKMYYDFYVLGKPIDIPAMDESQSSYSSCSNSKESYTLPNQRYFLTRQTR